MMVGWKFDVVVPLLLPLQVFLEVVMPLPAIKYKIRIGYIVCLPNTILIMLA